MIRSIAKLFLFSGFYVQVFIFVSTTNFGVVEHKVLEIYSTRSRMLNIESTIGVRKSRFPAFFSYQSRHPALFYAESRSHPIFLRDFLLNY